MRARHNAGALAAGVVLVAVLWTLAALSVAAMGLTIWVRGEARERQADAARLRAMALGQSALVHVLATNPPVTGEGVRRQWRVIMHDTSVSVLWTTAYAAIDINHAPVDLLQATLEHVGGVPSGVAAQWAAAIVQVRADPALAGRPAYDAVEDLLVRPGLPFAVWLSVQYALTVDSDDPGVDPYAVDDPLLMVLAQGDAARAARWAEDRRRAADIDTSPVPAAWLRRSVPTRWRAVARIPAEDGVFELTWIVEQGAAEVDGFPWRLLRQTLRRVPTN